MKPRILVAGDNFVLVSLLKQALREELCGIKEEPEFRELTLPWPDVPFGRIAEVDEASGSEEEMIAALQGVQICVTQMAPLTRKILSAAHDLRLFVVSRGGPVNANLEAATEHGVAVCFAPGRNATAAAEHTIALLLATLRRVPQTSFALNEGTWGSNNYRYDKCGMELENSTVGLIGSGAIGLRVARVLNSFGAHVLVYDPYVRAEQLTNLAEKVELDELLARSRIVSLHARLSDETRGMIDSAQIAAMPQGSIIINCARGALLDYDAVCDALDSGHLWGAGFDVFPAEPLPSDSRLRNRPNVVMTPHLAGASRETAEKAARISAEEVGRYLRGEPLAHCANPAIERRS